MDQELGEDEPPGGVSTKFNEFKSSRSVGTLNIKGAILSKGVETKVSSQLGDPALRGRLASTAIPPCGRTPLFTKKVNVLYPSEIWDSYPKENKTLFLDNLNYIFTAHLSLLLKKNIDFKYNTNYPLVYSWGMHCFMKFLPSYWYLHHGESEAKILPILRNIINTECSFEKKKRDPVKFQKTENNKIIVPFTFGKDSLLTYCVAKEIGLDPTLIYFNEPTEEFAKQHKLKLIEAFSKEKNEKINFIENNLAQLRSPGDGWFGWESTLTSYALLSLPFAYKTKASYIIFSNEIDCNYSFIGEEKCKVRYDFEQSSQATTEMSHITQNLGGTKCANFLNGLHEIAILAILKIRYRKNLKYLMSCWAETDRAKDKRWCENCSKCGRIFLFLSANGVDPIKEAGFKNNLFEKKYENLFNIFGSVKTEKITFDAIGTNRDEQLCAFYLAYLRHNKNPLVLKFFKSPLFKEAKSRFNELIKEYLTLHEENDTPIEWKKKIDKIFKSALAKTLTEIKNLK